MLVAALLAGCAAAPDLGNAPALRSAQSVAAARSLAGSAQAQWPGDGWWRGYGDPQLDSLIEEGLRNSPDAAIAAARMRRAAAIAQEAGAALLPTLDAQGAAG